MANNSFTELKKNRQTNIDKLNEEMVKVTEGKNKDNDEDSKFWKPTEDQAGNGGAIIRFLPAPPGEDIPFVRVFSHGFQGQNGSWYFENSLTTLGKADPVSEYNVKLWNSGSEADKKIARAQKRRLTFISNIYVVKDNGNPENEGKVFLYKYGKKIFDKINEAMNPDFDDQESMNPFDLWEGANMRMRFKKEGGFRQYDNSFATPGPLFKDDKKMEDVWKQEHSLQQFLDPSNFKTYEQLKERLNTVIGVSQNIPQEEPKAGKVMERANEPSSRMPDSEDSDEFDDIFNKISS